MCRGSIGHGRAGCVSIVWQGGVSFVVVWRKAGEYEGFQSPYEVRNKNKATGNQGDQGAQKSQDGDASMRALLGG